MLAVFLEQYGLVSSRLTTPAFTCCTHPAETGSLMFPVEIDVEGGPG
jgi:hypothetical protein